MSMFKSYYTDQIKTFIYNTFNNTKMSNKNIICVSKIGVRQTVGRLRRMHVQLSFKSYLAFIVIIIVIVYVPILLYYSNRLYSEDLINHDAFISFKQSKLPNMPSSDRKYNMYKDKRYSNLKSFNEHTKSYINKNKTFHSNDILFSNNSNVDSFLIDNVKHNSRIRNSIIPFNRSKVQYKKYLVNKKINLNLTKSIQVSSSKNPQPKDVSVTQYGKPSTVPHQRTVAEINNNTPLSFIISLYPSDGKIRGARYPSPSSPTVPHTSANRTSLILDAISKKSTRTLILHSPSNSSPPPLYNTSSPSPLYNTSSPPPLLHNSSTPSFEAVNYKNPLFNKQSNEPNNVQNYLLYKGPSHSIKSRDSDTQMTTISTDAIIEASKLQSNLYYDTRRRSRSLWRKDSIDCRDHTVHFSLHLPVCALVSYPGSGNTWLRYLIEASSGVFTGSVYSDSNIFKEGYYGEMEPWNAGTTLVQKTHYLDSQHISMFQGRAILLVRNPYRAILAFHNYLFSGHHNYASVSNYRRTDWESFVHIQAKSWLETLLKWTRESKQALVVHYELLQKDPTTQLKKILSFTHAPADHNRLQCLQNHLNGQFHRSDWRLPKDLTVFSPRISDKIDRAIRYADYILQKEGHTALPLHLYDFYDNATSEKIQRIPCDASETIVECDARVDDLNIARKSSNQNLEYHALHTSATSIFPKPTYKDMSLIQNKHEQFLTQLKDKDNVGFKSFDGLPISSKFYADAAAAEKPGVAQGRNIKKGNKQDKTPIHG